MMPNALHKINEVRAAIGRNYRSLVIGVVLLAIALAITGLFLRGGEPDPVGGPLMMRRLTEAQYRNSIADIFAADVPITGRFERPLRAEGLIAVGTGKAGMSPFAIEQYDASAQSIAAYVLSSKMRQKFVKCGPKSPAVFDERCAKAFLTDTGRLLFRRPLTQAEVASYITRARSATKLVGSFYGGLELSLYTMLVAPEFLFRIERAAPEFDTNRGDLDAYSRASRISFFLTNSTPDNELLNAAAEGDLDSDSGVANQVDRLMQSPRYEGTVRAFFADMMQFDKFADLSKDPEIYPAYNSELAQQAQEQTLRTIVEHVLVNKGDYRDLFTTRDTFLTRALGTIYQTPVPARDDWMAATFAKDANRSGIQSHVSFLALHSHPGRTSPTLRGYGMRQVFLCQDVPDPPATVNFSAVEANAHKPNVTARDRIAMHASEPSCAGCHKVMDPLGLALENYDGLGTFRTRENGATINTKGSLDGQDFSTADGLAKALHDHPETPRCVSERLYKSAVGRDIVWKERYYLDWLINGFAEDDYRIPDLMRRIATSKNFLTVTQPVPQHLAKNISNGGPL
jgi:Protein of unknown function (DUF1592)/Protein of unknown function (DUF1588)/Protein of unknown function (DUF1595)/Protein of unknown function (DUF1585)/Protein of unknown function (DUF1587)